MRETPLKKISRPFPISDTPHGSDVPFASRIMPGIMTGFLMSVTYSIDDFVISYFTHGATSQTLPITIFSMTRRKVSPEVNALSALLFFAILAIMLVMNVVELRKSPADQYRRSRKGGHA